MPRRDARVTVAGGEIAYTMAGSGEPLLLIHGLGGTRRTWRHLIDSLAETHLVIAPDLPGHGYSAAPAGDYSLGAILGARADANVACPDLAGCRDDRRSAGACAARGDSPSAPACDV